MVVTQLAAGQFTDFCFLDALLSGRLPVWAPANWAASNWAVSCLDA